MTDQEGRFEGIEEVAERLLVDPQTVRRWIKSGKLKAYKPGREYRIRSNDLDAFLEARSSPKVQSPQSESGAAALPEEEQRGLTVLYRELARKGRAVEQTLKSGEQPDFEEMKELDFAHALLAKKRGKRDIRGKDLDELAEAEDELFLVKASISRLLEQELFEDLNEKQRAEAEAFKRRQARTFKTEEQVTERDTA
jgi:excisionase family DNA binding protein